MPKPKLKRQTNVVPLHGVSYVIKNEPVAEVVSLLNTLLRRAKKGEIIGLAVGFVEGGTMIDTDWACGRAGNHAMVAAAQAIQYQFIKAWQEK